MAFPNSRGCELERQVEALEAELEKIEERHAIQIESLEGKATELHERLLTAEAQVDWMRTEVLTSQERSDMDAWLGSTND